MLLEDGMPSAKYELSSPVLGFTYLRGTMQRAVFDAGGFEETLVAVTGTFTNAPNFTGSILVRMNDAYFRSQINAVGNRSDHYQIGRAHV